MMTTDLSSDERRPGGDAGHSGTTSIHDEGPPLHVLDLFLVLAKYKRLIVGLPFLVGIVTAVYVLQLPDVFTATTRVLPPQQSQSALAGMVSQLGGLVGLGGPGGMKNPNDIYVAMLKSRTIADRLVDKFGIVEKFNLQHRTQARLWLEARSRIVNGKDGLITVEFDDQDKTRGTSIANAYIDELLSFTKVLAVTDASRRRLFFEQQLAQARDRLATAETQARQGLASGGVSKVDDQGRAVVEAAARLRGQISVKEIEIGAMRAFAAEGNPDLQRAQQQLGAMRAELDKLEGGERRSVGARNGAGADNLGLLRTVKYYETMYELLARQYEMAKIDEATDTTVVQIMDRAIEPDVKSAPHRTKIVLIATAVALILAMLVAIMREFLRKTCEDPGQKERIDALARQFTHF